MKTKTNKNPNNRMRPAVKERWLEALKSGKYQQGTEYLSKNGEFCCLGVLCDLYREVRHRGRWDDGYMYNVFVPRKGARGASKFLPPAVQKWSGINSTLGNILGKGTSLGEINDNSDSFKPTIKAIEKYF